METYQKNGYIILKNIISKNKQIDLLKYTNDIFNLPETSGKWMKFYETNNDNRLLSRVEYFLDFHNGLNNFEKEIIRPIAERYMGEEVSLLKEKINLKLPGGGAFSHHQDNPAWSDMPPKKYITIGLPIDNMTKENGYLYMSPEIHKEQKSYHNKDDRRIPKYYINKWKWNPVEIGLGDLVAFDSSSPHYSEINKTDKPRRIYYLAIIKNQLEIIENYILKIKEKNFHLILIKYLEMIIQKLAHYLILQIQRIQ